MNIVKPIFQLLAAFSLAKFLADYIIATRFINYLFLIYTGVTVIGLYLFFISSWRIKFILFALMIFFPLSMAGSSLPLNTVVEGLAPVLWVLSILEIIKSRQPLFSSKAFIYFVAIGVMALWGIIHYILNPVLGQITFGSGLQSGGLRNYFLIFAGISTFFCSYLFFKNNELNIDKYFPFFIIICLAIGVLYMIGLFVEIPLIKFIVLGSHDVTGEKLQYSSIPLRMISALVTALLLSLYHNKKWGSFFIIAFIHLIVFIIFGGGRTSFPLLFLVIIAYITIINRKYLFPVLSVLLISWGIYVLVLSNVTLSEYKFGRAFKVEGGLAEQDTARYYTFLYMYKIFEKSPLLGKGIGYEKITSQNEFFKENPDALQYIQYMESMSISGGHGTYLSILGIFGLGGFFWLMTFLLGGIYHSYRFIKINDGLDDNNTKVAIFVLLQLLSLAVAFYVGGDGGYENMRFWFLTGIIAGLISKVKIQKENALLDSGIILPKVTA